MENTKNIRTVLINDKQLGDLSLLFDFTDANNDTVMSFASAYLQIRYKQKVQAKHEKYGGEGWAPELLEPIMVKNLEYNARTGVSASDKAAKEADKIKDADELAELIGSLQAKHRAMK